MKTLPTPFTRLAIVAAATCLGAMPALADWNATAITQGTTTDGDTGSVECAPGGVPGAVWGTGTYTSDSSICGAAQHFGWINAAEGGRVSYRMVAGLGAYEGSSQNGVTTSDYGTWSLSLQITGAEPLAAVAPAPTPGTRAITWGDNADALDIGEALGETFTLSCPADQFGGGTIWGTDVYSSDSPICNAAVHRGHIVAAEGGPVTILILGSQPTFTGTERNGVASADFGEWPRSYVFQ